MSSATLTYASPATASNAIKLYWRGSGLALAAVAGLGIVLNAVGAGAFLPRFLEFDWTHNVVHVLLAAVALGVGFGGVAHGLAKSLAKVVGVVYLGLGVVGFLSATVFGLGSLLGLHLEMGENLVHIALGAWGAYVGFTE